MCQTGAQSTLLFYTKVDKFLYALRKYKLSKMKVFIRNVIIALKKNSSLQVRKNRKKE